MYYNTNHKTVNLKIEEKKKLKLKSKGQNNDF